MSTIEWEVVENLIPVVVARVDTVARSRPKEVADAIVRDMQATAPVDTGEMVDSMSAVAEIAGFAATVQIGVDYWMFPNYGTRYQAAQPFVEPAIDLHVDDLPEALVAALVL